MEHPDLPPSSSPPRSNAPFSPGPPRTRRTDACRSTQDSEHCPFEISSVKYRVGAPPLRPLPLETLSQSPLERAQPPFDDAIAIEADLISAAHRILQRHGILGPWAGWESVDRLLRPIPDTDMIEENWDDEPSDDRVSLVTRVVSGHPDVFEPTLLIVAPWESGSAQLWEAAVTEMKAAVNSRMQSAGRPEFDITVEMVAPELVADKYVGVVAGEPLLEAAWPTLGQRILRELESFLGPDYPLPNISLLRLGYNRDANLNPITVYIAMGYTSKEAAWPPMIAAIERYLDEAGWGHLLVHMEHNEVLQPALEPNNPDDTSTSTLNRNARFVIEGEYAQRVDLGADIGAGAYMRRDGEDGEVCSTPPGTLGCYVEVKTTASTPGWETMGLSCRHVVRPCSGGFVVNRRPEWPVSSAPGRPLPNSALQDFDASDGSGADNGVEHPSRMRHNATVAHLRRKATQGFPWAQPELDRKLAFFDDDRQVLGRVWASSGYSRHAPEGNQLDWALVQVRPERRGANVLPAAEAWASKYVELPESSPQNFPNPRTFGATLRPRGETSLRATSGEKPSRVFGVGAASGVICGTFSHVKSAITIGGDGYRSDRGPAGERRKHVSWEYFYVEARIDYGRQRPSTQGDCGAVVFDEHGAALGLVVGGQIVPRQSRQPLAYVTPIEDVFEDIKISSQGKILDIRVA